MGTYKRVVFKIGSSSLTYENGKLNLQYLEKFVRTLAGIQNSGVQVVLVTSGAVSVGTSKLRLSRRPTVMSDKQAAAAIGQCELMYLYDKLFSEYGQTVAQVLLTRDVVDDELRKQNLVNTFESLLSFGAIPIINENDTLSFEEIEYIESFGDNDTLSAIVATLVKADLLILMSDIDGLYTGDPHTNPDAVLIHRVGEITESIRALAGGAGSAHGTGGMVTKLRAAQIALEGGFDMLIQNAKNLGALTGALEGLYEGTLFSRNHKKSEEA